MYKYFDDLNHIISIIKPEFQIIGITEHKIKDSIPTSNIEIAGYHEFIFNPTQTSHGGTGFYVKDNLAVKKRDNLLLKSPGPGEFESTFLEIVFPNQKNLIIGCIYRHPSSTVNVEDFSTMYLEPILSIISAENKNCSLVGDFNIDLVKLNSHNNVNNYYNNLTNHFFAPYILQPTQPQSKTLIDNIFLNTMEYCSYSGNITIQLSDHLFQFVLLEGYFHDIKPKKIIIKERNYKHFNERKFLETVQNLNIEEILCLDDKDPNISITNLYNNINYLLDEFASYKKLNKHEIKFKTKPWINKKYNF